MQRQPAIGSELSSRKGRMGISRSSTSPKKSSSINFLSDSSRKKSMVLKATVCVSLQVFSMNAAENCESKLKMLTAAMAGVSHATPPGA